MSLAIGLPGGVEEPGPPLGLDLVEHLLVLGLRMGIIGIGEEPPDHPGRHLEARLASAKPGGQASQIAG